MHVHSDQTYADDYIECLRDFLVPAVDLLYPMGWFLVQDNGPCHKGSAMDFVRENLALIRFPKRSPDHNPIIIPERKFIFHYMNKMYFVVFCRQ